MSIFSIDGDDAESDLHPANHIDDVMCGVDGRFMYPSLFGDLNVKADDDAETVLLNSVVIDECRAKMSDACNRGFIELSVS